MPVLEIADRDKVHFPGFDGVLLSYHQLREMVDDPRYADWRIALSEVQGIYLITDSSNGKQYVGKADGAERILGRWTAYARDGHGGNVALRELAQQSALGERAGMKTDHARHFVFSLLRVFGPSTPSSEVNSAESHYKAALMTRQFGLNRN
ncbi:GIY-YIG nuclease family protein [Arthrobacter sp. AK04]|uniref:GIY-YIG nuclease family protein n=1 Tax=Arthrobacter sp. AK04 TaxID=2900048 RepID=UPI001E58D833|nr:GIY-YIG nuclease family protein [Arthrobacter sp. AK04]MCD5341741.1 GIY-YIG nuclease family protein [Arthrobacter sp. AK04]